MLLADITQMKFNFSQNKDKILGVILTIAPHAKHYTSLEATFVALGSSHFILKGTPSSSSLTSLSKGYWYTHWYTFNFYLYLFI